MCFHCGSSLSAPSEPPPAEPQSAAPLPPPSAPQPAGEFCPHCSEELPSGLTACFGCGKPLDLSIKPEPTQTQQQAPDTQKQSSGKKKTPAIAALIIIVLLLGGAVGGHFMGLYSLPFLPSETDPADPTPSTSNTPAPTATPDPTTPPSGDDVFTLSAEDREKLFYGFGHGDLKTTFDWHTSPEYPNQVGSCRVNFNLVGKTQNVAGAFIAQVEVSRQDPWHYEEILRMAEQTLSRLKESFSWPGQPPPENVDSIETGFAIRQEMLGNSVDLLIIVVDKDLNPLGHLLFGFAMPSEADAGRASNAYNPYNIPEPPTIEFTVDGEYLLESKFADVVNKYSSVLEEDVTFEYEGNHKYAILLERPGNNGGGVQLFGNENGDIVVVIINHNLTTEVGGYFDYGNSGVPDFILLGKYIFGSDEYSPLHDFIGFEFTDSQTSTLLYEDGYKELFLQHVGRSGYRFIYRQGNKQISIMVEDNYIVRFSMVKIAD